MSKGKVFKWSGRYGNGYVIDNDGVQYYVHESELISAGKLKNGVIIEFDSIDEGKDHLRAVNIKKIGHGKHHPFINDLERIREHINNGIKNEETQYRNRDIDMLINYFSNIEDIDWCADVKKKFRQIKESDIK